MAATAVAAAKRRERQRGGPLTAAPSASLGERLRARVRRVVPLPLQAARRVRQGSGCPEADEYKTYFRYQNLYDIVMYYSMAKACRRPRLSVSGASGQSWSTLCPASSRWTRVRGSRPSGAPAPLSRRLRGAGGRARGREEWRASRACRPRAALLAGGGAPRGT